MYFDCGVLHACTISTLDSVSTILVLGEMQWRLYNKGKS